MMAPNKQAENYHKRTTEFNRLMDALVDYLTDLVPSIEEAGRYCYTDTVCNILTQKQKQLLIQGDGMQNSELARFNMIEQQIRPCGVREGRILELLKHVRREHFVPADKKDLAFADMEIPLGHGVAMWQPKFEALVLQALRLSRTDRVLEVGTGSGYLTALLSSLAGSVISVEVEPELSARAKKNLAGCQRDNITLETGNAAHGWGGNSYDVIVLTGSTPILPENFRNSLNMGGRLFAILGDAPLMEAVLITRIAADTFETINVTETCITPLVTAEQPKRFTF